MTQDDFDLVELAAWTPPSDERTRAGSALREVAFRPNAWLPAEDELLRTQFADDTPIEAIARSLGRPLEGVRDRMWRLGLRRSTRRPWSDLEDEELARRYATEPAAAIAQDLGRNVTAVYVRAAMLGLSQPAAPPWTPWEDAQLEEVYKRGLSLAQLVAVVGRPASGIHSRASKRGLRHPSHPEGWTDAEIARALELANEGHLYAHIRALMVGEGFPARTKQGFGLMVRKLGYSRGWGRAWTPEEDELLRRTYTQGGSVKALTRTLQRTASSIQWRARELKLQGTHVNTAGWRTEPVWSAEDEAVLRAEYGVTPTAKLARRLGRRRSAVLQRAAHLGLKHGMHKPWSDREAVLIAVAWRIGVSLTDLAAMLHRDPAVVGKYARRLGFGLSDPSRPARAARGPRAGRQAPTADQVLSQATDQERAVIAIPLKRRGRAAPAYGAGTVEGAA